MQNLIGQKKDEINFNKLQGINKIDELKAKIKSTENELFNLRKRETSRLFKEKRSLSKRRGMGSYTRYW